ncbi:hypothetical protein MOD96_01290 [Bacillus sp. S17B2]|uniref:hypothetical protein n=1 Tax=Bacillus sp. S17B2 TaxID=2918907 RepID=UPI00227FCC28|nr:hypothetical protein [Bacillus sp. S17B2]
MNNFNEGIEVKPLTGFWKGFVGVITEINIQADPPIIVEFEDNERNGYYENQLEIVQK